MTIVIHVEGMAGSFVVTAVHAASILHVYVRP